MGGCNNCQAKTGCGDRKGTMFDTLGEALARLYPTKVWGEPDDAARFEAGVCEHDSVALAEELAVELNAATFFRRGEPEEFCDYIYVLCVGRSPCLVQQRDFGVEAAVDVGPGEVIQERYLRLCLSTMSRLAGVQEVAVELEDGVIREQPRAGVYEASLLRRMQRLVATLPAYDITHLDFGEISAPLEGYSPGRYGELYGGTPDTANYIFYPQPTNIVSTTVLDSALLD